MKIRWVLHMCRVPANADRWWVFRYPHPAVSGDPSDAYHFATHYAAARAALAVQRHYGINFQVAIKARRVP